MVAEQFGSWLVIGAADVLGRKLVCKCSTCGSIRTIAAEALKHDPPHCDCQPTERSRRSVIERRMPDWRPGR